MRDLLAAIDALGALGLGGDATAPPATDDRALAASAVLADLA
jgi:hypothetical protein